MQRRKSPKTHGKQGPARRQPGPGKPRRRRKSGVKPDGYSGDGGWLYGQHTVRAALANPRRQVERILAADDDSAAALREIARGQGRDGLVERVNREDLTDMLPPDALHQGVALLAAPLPQMEIEDICDAVRDKPQALTIVLDQVTDPHNVGAIVRTAAAFGAVGLIVQNRHAPPLGGVLAKAASGGLESCPLVRVTNIARALGQLKEAGYWCVGLDADGAQSLRTARGDGPMALILGAEGAGLRRLTRETCDALAAIPLAGPIASLNVSNAAAIALYELAGTEG